MLEQLKNCIGLTDALKLLANSHQMIELSHCLKEQYSIGKNIYPPEPQIFNAFNVVPFHQYKVVIIGQDPYYGPGQANGLAFSVNAGIKIPASLRNIFKELNNDLGIDMPSNGDLHDWAKQGVLLLNSVLTVEEAKPGSHQGIGWEQFTDSIISEINMELNGIVFMLWGNFAKSKKKLIDAQKHLILESNHPSPLSAHRGFFYCKHFSKANNYLLSKDKTPINWSLRT
jgi:uracil-DNA glycosylase